MLWRSAGACSVCSCALCVYRLTVWYICTTVLDADRSFTKFLPCQYILTLYKRRCLRATATYTTSYTLQLYALIRIRGARLTHLTAGRPPPLASRAYWLEIAFEIERAAAADKQAKAILAASPEWARLAEALPHAFARRCSRGLGSGPVRAAASAPGRWDGGRRDGGADAPLADGRAEDQRLKMQKTSRRPRRKVHGGRS